MLHRGWVRGLVAGPASALIAVVAVGCVPDAPAPTYLDVHTQLTWCGGVVPPPGEPACHTSSRSAAIEIRSGRNVVATGTTGTDGHLLVAVPSGAALTVAAASAPPYEQCDQPTIVAVAAATTSVTQTCTVFAP